MVRNADGSVTLKTTGKVGQVGSRVGSPARAAGSGPTGTGGTSSPKVVRVKGRGPVPKDTGKTA